MLDTFIENYSEGLGDLISVPVLKAFSKAIPQRLKNATFVKVAEQVLRNTKMSKSAKIGQMVYERSMFNGLIGEYTEEKWGDAMRAVSTAVARALGTKWGDLGQETVFGSLDQEAELMGGLLLTGGVISSVRSLTLPWDIRRVSKFIDTQRAVNAAVQKVSAPDPDGNPIVERMVRNYSGRSDWAYLPAQNARALFQSAPEVMESIGITEDVIAEAENNDRLIPVSMAAVHTRVKSEQVNELIMNMVPDPEADLTAAEAEKIDLSAEEQEKFKAQEAEQQEALAAYNDALAQLRQLGRSESEIRAAAKFLSMAHYFAAHSNESMSAADWIRNVAFQKLRESDWQAQLNADPVYAQTALDTAIVQARSSAGTSLNQVAAAFKKIKFVSGTVNLDLGGGRFDKASDFLAAQGVTNLVYDPANRDPEHNAKVFDAVRSGGVDTVTCNNVLNVIQEPGARSNVILQAAKALKPGGIAYFSVYEGDKSAQGRPTKSDSWQENRPTESYMDEIRQHFADVTRQGKVIIARSPLTDGKTSAWFNDGFTAGPR
ncbi:MAG: hypothetical protein IJU05_06930, partial [Schwartzia sp.]|nr:hypothetical protein [Schwartzia sp. (in: firmicutes)]